MTFGHGGHIRKLARSAQRNPEDILDFSANINPLGPPECLRPVVSLALADAVHYPDPECEALVGVLAAAWGAEPDQVIVGNGSTEILRAVPRALEIGRAVIPLPTYSDYESAARLAGLEACTCAMSESDDFRLDWTRLHGCLTEPALVFLGRPNNPTGGHLDAEACRAFARQHPDSILVIDEAFIEFVSGEETLARDVEPNVIVLRSLTKFYAIPGLRLGAAVASAAIAQRIREQIPPWSVNTLALSVGVAVLKETEYAEETRRVVRQLRRKLSADLKALPGLHVYPSDANFLLVRIDGRQLEAHALAERLLHDGIAIRVCANFEGLDDRFFRVAVRPQEESETLVAALAGILNHRRTSSPSPKRTPALMLQGINSNSGKSVLTSALCRIMLQDGVRVAPFKSQNMSLNSYVTLEGDEMGRAQVVQAQACRLDPDVRMNPILLKPGSDTGCQVIVRGRPVANMVVAEYIRYKPEAFAVARACYDSLCTEYDAVILEGAGSPAEVNLKHHDIVNMAMARYARAPVLLVGDIDRGGVFAAFVGTLEVLAEWERALVAGFVINRFRGEASLLEPAFDYMLRHTGKPVLGVVPFLRDLGLPEEDSVEFKSGALDREQGPDAAVEVTVIDLPHISNFTDFDPFRIEPDVRLRIARSREELGAPDALIIPGSKNVQTDLEYLRRTGLAAEIIRIAECGKTEIVGICGGFQMLGKEIDDPTRVESDRGVVEGLGLFNATTTMAPDKRLTNRRSMHRPSGCEVHGYEIHHGRTRADNVDPLFDGEDGGALGVCARTGRIWGTYLHGVFDADRFRRWFIDGLRVGRGLEPHGTIQAAYEIESALDRLADVVRESLDMKRIYEWMGL